MLLTFKLYEDNFINNYFYGVNNNFPIQTNGILRRDFLQKYSAAIQYEDYSITCINSYKKIIFILQYATSEYIFIPPRTEGMFRRNFNNTGKCLISNDEIKKRCFHS